VKFTQCDERVQLKMCRQQRFVDDGDVNTHSVDDVLLASLLDCFFISCFMSTASSIQLFEQGFFPGNSHWDYEAFLPVLLQD